MTESYEETALGPSTALDGGTLRGDEWVDGLQYKKPPPCTINNCVGTASLGVQSIDLEEIAWRCTGEFDKSSFAACLIRNDTPEKTTCLVFGTGKIVVTGASTEINLKESMIRYFMLIWKKMPEIRHKLGCINMQIQNIVAHGNLGQPIDLVKVYKKHNIDSSYQPELFPGIRFNIPDIQTKALVFLSGKAVITGAKNREEIAKSWLILYRSMYPFFTDNAMKHDDVISQRRHLRAGT